MPNWSGQKGGRVGEDPDFGVLFIIHYDHLQLKNKEILTLSKKTSLWN